MHKDPNLLAALRLSALLQRRSKTKPVPGSLSTPSEGDSAWETALKTALRQLGQVSADDQLIQWLENTGLELLQNEEQVAYALEEIAQRSAGQSCQPAILQALKNIAQDRDPETARLDQVAHFPAAVRDSAASALDVLGYLPPDLPVFVSIPSAQTPGFHLAKYPVTNAQYLRFLKTENFANRAFWCNFPKYSEPDQAGRVQVIGSWADEGWERLQAALTDPDYAEVVKDGVFLPRSWVVPRLSPPRMHVPVVGISWFEANAYCKWLHTNWNDLEEGRQGLAKPDLIRLPSGTEWVLAAGGAQNGRLAWGGLKDEKELSRCANIGCGRTTPVWMYPQGASLPYQLMDMTGNVTEWQANPFSDWFSRLPLRGGTWVGRHDLALTPDEDDEEFPVDLFEGGHDIGFRVAAITHPEQL